MGDQMIVKLHISRVVHVLPNLLPPRQFLSRLSVLNGEIVVMNEGIISDEQFCW